MQSVATHLHCRTMRSPWLWLALALHVALATGYAFRTPAFEGPDENSHYEYAWHIANAKDLPLAASLAKARGEHQTAGAALAHHPPLYYALLAAALVATGTDDTVFCPRLNPAFGDPSAASRHLRFLHERHRSRVLFGLRLISVLLGALTIVCVHRLGRATCPAAPRVADLAALLVACLPMWSFLHGVLNSDVLAALSSSATLLALVRLCAAERPTAANALGAGALLGLAWLTKLTTLFLGGIALVVAFVVWRREARAGRSRRWLGLCGLAAAAALAVSGWVFVRNYALYGDPLAMAMHDAAFPPIPAEYRWPFFRDVFLRDVFTSLLGRFGWFSLPPPAALVWCGAAAAALALAGLARAAFDRPRSGLPRPLWLLVLACALVFAATAAFNLKAPQPQGRLLFPAIAPAAVLLAAGLVRATARLPRRRWLVALLPLTAGAVFFAWFAPAFDPALAPAPPDHRSLVGGIAAAAHPPAIEWTVALPATPLADPPTLRWRDPAAPPDTRYTLYARGATGRVWLATHEWSQGGLAIRGAELTVPDAAWQFLPRGRPLEFVLRRVPATDDDDPAALPASPGLPFVRE